ncbi:MAG: carboxypeptidase regulatory-like domain-containing protein [Armatimonadetes bacterium]|nr:carboxypeptidase regulatory-like domain-containing protein [Armatimonadota bacterium]
MQDLVINRRTFALLSVASLAALLAGCGGGGGGGTGGGGGGTASSTVTGIVRDSAQNDIEIENATVVIGGVSGTTVARDNVTTGNEVGTFRLLNVTEGSSTATITFVNTRVTDDTTTPPTTETFTDTQTVAFTPPTTRGGNGPYEFFVNIGQVNGRVLLPSGLPAAGAFVSISPDGFITETDAAGNFFVENILPGTIEISGVIGTNAATKSVTIGNGITGTGDLQLVADPNPLPPGFPATIVGKVTTTTGVSGAGATVILSRDGTQAEQTIANENGDFSFYVPVGSYAVRVLKDAFVDNTASGAVTNPNTPLRLDVALSPRI